MAPEMHTHIRHHRPDPSGAARARSAVTCPRWLRTWTLTCTFVSGVFALVWLLLRSGSKPSRFFYPCQQAAFWVAAAAFGAPLVATVVTLRRQLGALLRPTPRRIAAGVPAALCIAVLVSSSGTCVSNTPVLILDPPAGYSPDVYVAKNARGIETGRYGGVDDLVTLMGENGFKLHRSETEGATAGADGLIDVDDVVLLKISAQWAERGGTNTDVLRGVIRQIVEHPDGFVGEIIVADNGQGLGDLNRANNNAEDQHQSPQDVVNDFVAEGWPVSGLLWDSLMSTFVDEYSDGDMDDGYIISEAFDPDTSIKVTYPKFKSDAGAYISYKHGVWSPASQTYDSGKLVVINMPILKTHYIYAVTASVKNLMGLVSNSFWTDSHNAVARGGMGTVLAEVRMPDLNLLDCVWVLARPGAGPWATYAEPDRMDQLAASTDPVALDVWAAKYILIPQIIANGYSVSDYGSTQDPDNSDSTFRQYLDRSMNELLAAGIETTNDYSTINVYESSDTSSASD